jgi:two-component system cell cycle response regulator DivK
VTGATILVVEDNDRNLKLVRDVLEHAGFHVVVASSGETGVDLAVEHPPDLVLLDLGLPGIDGHEALRRLRASPRTRSLPVVAVTAYAMAADRARALEAGFDGYLEKPLDVRSLPLDVCRYLQAEEAPRD